jgi:hypothetical protein
MSVFSTHQGRDKMIARLSSRCYWPKQYEDVADFVKFCKECQEIKPPARYNVAELIPILANKPLEIITTDIMGPLNMTIEENKYIMIICDHFTKWIELYALKTMEAVEVANKISSFVCRHGVPDKIITDQATNYQSNLISELYVVLDIEKARTSSYHTESDGLSERGNRTNKEALTALVNEKQDNWDVMLPFIQFAYNSSGHATTRCTPFELMYGRQPRIPLDLLIPEAKIELDIDPGEYASNLRHSFVDAYRLVKKNRDMRMNKEKINYVRRVRAANYIGDKVGDKVLLLNEAKKAGISNKFRKSWIGPYEIIGKIANNVNYKIKPVIRNGRSKWVHQNKLKTFFANGKTSENVKKEPVEIEFELGQKEAREGQLKCVDTNEIL